MLRHVRFRFHHVIVRSFVRAWQAAIARYTMRPMLWVALAALLWIAVHIGIAGSRLRCMIVCRIGEGPFRGLFSVLSIITIVLLILAYGRAPSEPLWYAPVWLRWLLAIVMVPAFLLFAGSLLARNPTLVGAESGVAADPRGIFRVTRDPMLWSFAIWAGVHIIGNGDLASVFFFGAFLVVALAGMPSIDRKLAARNGAAFRHLADRTSIIPFAAIAAGRNRFVPGEIGWQIPLLGVVLWIALLAAHRATFGVPAVVL
jgi:uncharacterized membrane protein